MSNDFFISRTVSSQTGEPVINIEDIDSTIKTVSLKFSHVNVQGSLNNHISVEMFLKSYFIDILCISEHLINVSHATNNVYFGNYEIASIYAQENHIHGGFLLYIYIFFYI